MIAKLALIAALAGSACATGTPSPAALQSAYEHVLWEMMFLEHCSSRFDRPHELAQARARQGRLLASANGAGLGAALEAGQRRHNRKMVRVDTSCPNGIEAQLAETMTALAAAERAVGGQGRGVD